MEQKRVAAYCRVSTVAELQDSSFETQRDAYIQLIDGREDLVLVDIYGDHGKSGTSIKRRTEFQRMLRDCEAGKIDLIMTKSISRFARNLRDCLTTIDRLKELGIAVIFEKEGINTLDNKSDLLLNVLAVVAEEESASIGQNMRWAHERRNAAGDPFHKPPYGYGRVTLVLTHEAYIGDVLTNKTYCPNRDTQVLNHGERDQYYIEGHHEPIVDRETFPRVQTLIERKLLYTGKRTFSQEDLDFLNNVQPTSGQHSGKGVSEYAICRENFQ